MNLSTVTNDLILYNEEEGIKFQQNVPSFIRFYETPLAGEIKSINEIIRKNYIEENANFQLTGQMIWRNHLPKIMNSISIQYVGDPSGTCRGVEINKNLALESAGMSLYGTLVFYASPFILILI